MKAIHRRILRASSAVLLGTAVVAGANSATADTINIRIASGHPPTVVYAGLMKNFFQPELKKAVESKTKYKVNFIEGYSGSIVKVFDTLEGVQNGVVDIGGFCYCFEASKVPMHAFQIMLPFGTMDPVQSVAAAAEIYRQFPSLENDSKTSTSAYRIMRDGGLQPRPQRFRIRKKLTISRAKEFWAPGSISLDEQAGIQAIVPVTEDCRLVPKLKTVLPRAHHVPGAPGARPSGCGKSASTTPPSASARSPGTG